jgi:hypothetical protein
VVHLQIESAEQPKRQKPPTDVPVRGGFFDLFNGHDFDDHACPLCSALHTKKIHPTIATLAQSATAGKGKYCRLFGRKKHRCPLCSSSVYDA